MKFAPLTLSLVALLASAAFVNCQEKSEEAAVRKVIADFAEAINRGESDPQVAVAISADTDWPWAPTA